MFKSSSEKTNTHAAQTKAATTAFFRKAGGESFFGEKSAPSFFNPSIQTKLNVSSPDDPQEKEADAVADRVMRMPDPAPVSSNEKKEEVQRKEEEQPDVGVSETIQPKEEKEKEKIQTRLFRKIYRSAEDHETISESIGNSTETYHVNRKEISIHHSDVIQRSGRGPPQNSIQFEQTLSTSKGGGSALPGDTRQFMESRFNADFSGVKIHTGSTAETLSNTIHAQAFTHGNDIYFNSSKYSPNTADGGSLLAHELTHTIQQGASQHHTSPQNNSTVAAKKIQRQQTTTTFQTLPVLNTRETSEDTRLQKPAFNNRPRTLRDMRKDAFNIDKKEESGADNSSSDEFQETSIQPKIELSNWTVNPSGTLLTVPPLVTNLSVDSIQQKEVSSEIKNEEEEKIQPSIQPSFQKKTLAGLQRKNEIAYLTTTTTSENYSVQKQTEFNDSSLKHETDGATSVASNERDRGPPTVQAKSNTGLVIQRSWLGDAWDAVSGFVGEAAEVIARGLDAAKEWILRRIRSFVQNIPGYNILALILQHDPITHEPVERSGRNILLAGLQLIPGGSLFQAVLERLDAINEAGAWIDGRIGDLLSIVSGIGNRFTQFMNDLSLDDIGNPEGVLNRVADLFRGIFNDVTGFMIRAAVDFLDMIKRIMLRLIVDFVRERIPRLYPLLRVALGHDPVTGEEVARNGHNILYAALDATDAGREQRRQMEETGTFARVAAWIDRGIAVFSTAYQLLRQAFTNLWASVTIDNLFSPVETFNRIYNDFAAPISLVGNFLLDLAIEIVRLIKDALLRRLRDYARTVRGYFLVSVIIGRDPFTSEVVPRTIPNIIRGFMSLMEGGEEQYRQMEESGAIARTTQRIEAAVARLNMTPAYIIQLFTDLWNSFGLNDLAHPIDAFMRILGRFGEPIGRLIAFVIEIVKIVIHVILEIMNFPFDLINNIITRSMAAFERIKQDPIGFLKNLLRAVKQGFIQFFNNILRHLLGGLTGWLMSELRDANVPAPTDFSLRGIIGWVLQVLGISMEAIWTKLAAHPRVGPQRVARIRSMINTLEGIWTFIKDVQERGMAAIWDKIQEQLTRLWDMVLDAVKNWVMERIINQMVARLLSMLDPTGIMAVINSAIAIYRAVQSFIRYLRQMLEVINSFVNGVADIAEGNVTTAANYLENTMGRAMPIVVGFFANQVGLSGIGRRIAEIIGRVREMVDRALTWLVNRAVDTGMALIDRMMAFGRDVAGRVINAIRGWLGFRKEFRTNNGENHSLYLREQGGSVQMIMASNPVNFDLFIQQKSQEFANLPANDPKKQLLESARQKNDIIKMQIQNLNQRDATAAAAPTASASRTIREGQPTYLNTLFYITLERTTTELMEILKSLVSGPTDYPPIRMPSFVNNSWAYRVKGDFIQKNRFTRFSSSNASQHQGNLEGWQELQNANLTRGANWVRMHLYTHRLGGLPTDSNLVPAPRIVNTPAMENLEESADTVVQNNPTEAIWYEVSVSYQDVVTNPTNRTSKRFISGVTGNWGKYEFRNGRHEEVADTRARPVNISGILAPAFTTTGLVTWDIHGLGEPQLHDTFGIGRMESRRLSQGLRAFQTLNIRALNPGDLVAKLAALTPAITINSNTLQIITDAMAVTTGNKIVF